jgi:HEAT repeat protein
MGKRLSVEEKLSAIRRLRELEPSAHVVSELRLALRDKSNLIVAAAAAIVGDKNHTALCPELAAAFERCLVDPLTSDKLCRGKIAIVHALDKLEHDQPDIFLHAARHVQLEPVWGGSEDSAALLRAAAILALARLDYRDLLPLLVDALTDPKKEVRLAAAQALGHHGSEPASLLLRLKARMGDKEPDVVSECLSGLLSCAPRESLPLVSQFLDSDDDAICEAAVLALGRSRLPEAFELLKTYQQQHPIGLNEEIFLAMVMLRLPVATDYLLDIIATDGETTASAALSALLLYRHDPALRERIDEAVRKSGSRALRTKFEQAAGSDD